MRKEIIYGIHSIENLIKYDYKRFICIYILDKNNNSRLYTLVHLIKKYNIIVYKANRKWLDKITKGSVHQGVVAFIYKKQRLKESDLSLFLINRKQDFFLVLDGVTDPHNLGACLRCANAAGVSAIILPKKKSVPLNATVRKVASGSAEVTPLFYVTNLSRSIELLKKNNIFIIGTSHKSNINIYNIDLTVPLAFVIGSEHNGIRNLIFKNCDKVVNIPMSGVIPSLNLSIASGICLFETVRQRRYIKILN